MQSRLARVLLFAAAAAALAVAGIAANFALLRYADSRDDPVGKLSPKATITQPAATRPSRRRRPTTPVTTLASGESRRLEREQRISSSGHPGHVHAPTPPHARGAKVELGGGASRECTRRRGRRCSRTDRPGRRVAIWSLLMVPALAVFYVPLYFVGSALQSALGLAEDEMLTDAGVLGSGCRRAHARTRRRPAGRRESCWASRRADWASAGWERQGSSSTPRSERSSCSAPQYSSRSPESRYRSARAPRRRPRSSSSRQDSNSVYGKVMATKTTTKQRLPATTRRSSRRSRSRSTW